MSIYLYSYFIMRQTLKAWILSWRANIVARGKVGWRHSHFNFDSKMAVDDDYGLQTKRCLTIWQENSKTVVSLLLLFGTIACISAIVLGKSMSYLLTGWLVGLLLLLISWQASWLNLSYWLEDFWADIIFPRYRIIIVLYFVWAFI